MSICIFYFSGTGNTWWASNKLAEELKIKGRTAEAYSIELLDDDRINELIEESEIIVFGYPIYGSCIPDPMKKFIDNLPKPTKNKKTGIFCTQQGYSGDGAWYYHKNLENKGYEVKWTYHFNLPGNICLRVAPMTYTVDPVKINKIFQKCEGKIEEAAEDIVNDTPSYTGNSIGSLVLAMFQRPFFKMASKKPLKSVFKVDNEKCTKCMRCIQICPEGNIKLADGTIAFGKNCSLCMRCYNYCPQTAILGYGVKHNDKKPPYKGPADFDPALITPQKNLMDYIE